MASVNSWIDPEQLAALAAELTGAKPEAAGANAGEDAEPTAAAAGAEDAGGAGTAIGGGNDVARLAADVSRIGAQLAEIKARAVRSGLLRSASTSGAAAAAGTASIPRRIPGTGASLVDRLESFVAWAAGQEGLTGLFIADCAGHELVESGADPALVASGVALAEGWDRARGVLESTARNGVSTGASVRDSEGSMLTVFSCRSAYGRHVLGVLTPEPLGIALSAGLRAGFARVLGVGEG